MSVHDACDIIRAGTGRGMAVMVRTPTLNRGEITRLLEAGAAGIQLARGSGSAAVDLRQVVSYPPIGSRSVSMAQPAADYGIGVSLSAHLERANSEVLAVAQFETADYGQNIDTAMASLDVAFIGPVDLSVDLDTPGDLGSEQMRRAVAAIEAAAESHNVPMGIFAGSSDAAESARTKGYRYIVVLAR